MARCHFRHTVTDDLGNSIQNAKAFLYQPGTTTAVTGAWSAKTAGTAVTYLISNNQGEIECWFDEAQEVDVFITDNNDSAYYPGRQSVTELLTFDPDDVPLLASNNTFTGDNIFQGGDEFSGDLAITGSITGLGWVDPRRYGVTFDGVTDDTDAWNDLITDLGAQTTARAFRIRMLGSSKISSTLTFKYLSVHLEGAGWGSKAGGATSVGGRFLWAGGAAVPMVRFRACQGIKVERIVFDPGTGGTPSACISMQDLTDSQGNSFNLISQCWFGRLLGWDGTVSAGATSAILFEGNNTNNDQSVIDGCVIFGAGFTNGIAIANTQSVLIKIANSTILGCSYGLVTNASVNLDKVFFSLTTVTDIFANQSADVIGREVSSESTAQFASLNGSSNLSLVGGYCQITNSLTGSGSAGNIPVIDVGPDGTHGRVHLVDFRWPFQGYTNPGTPVVNLGATSGSTKKVLLTENTSGAVPAFMKVGAAGGTRQYTGNYDGTEWDSTFVLPSQGFDYTPPFSYNWINVQGGVGYQNSWVDYGSGQPGARFRIYGTLVELGGWMKSGTVGTTAFTLPVGYRPAALDVGFAVPSNSAFGYVTVHSDGKLTVNAGNNTWVNLDNISFRTDA